MLVRVILSFAFASKEEVGWDPTIRPFVRADGTRQYRIDVEDAEWTRGRDNVTTVLKEELKVVDAAAKKLEDQVGGRKKARDVMAFVDRVRSGQVVLEGDGIGGAGGFSAALLAKGTLLNCSAKSGWLLTSFRT